MDAGYVQLNTWFGDVYARILRVNINKEQPTYSSVTFVTYEKYGKTRSMDSAYFSRIRCFRARLPKDAHIIYEPDTYKSYGQVVKYNIPLTKDSPWRRYEYFDNQFPY